MKGFKNVGKKIGSAFVKAPFAVTVSDTGVLKAFVAKLIPPLCVPEYYWLSMDAISVDKESIGVKTAMRVRAALREANDVLQVGANDLDDVAQRCFQDDPATIYDLGYLGDDTPADSVLDDDQRNPDNEGRKATRTNFVDRVFAMGYPRRYIVADADQQRTVFNYTRRKKIRYRHMREMNKEGGANLVTMAVNFGTIWDLAAAELDKGFRQIATGQGTGDLVAGDPGELYEDIIAELPMYRSASGQLETGSATEYTSTLTDWLSMGIQETAAVARLTEASTSDLNLTGKFTMRVGIYQPARSSVLAL